MNLCKYIVCGAGGYVDVRKVNKVHFTGPLGNSYFWFPKNPVYVNKRQDTSETKLTVSQGASN